MKTLLRSTFLIFSFLFFCLLQLSAQNISDKKVSIEKTGGKIRLIDAQGVDLSAQYKIQSLDVDLYDTNNQYAGSLSVQGEQFPIEELKQGEQIKINTIKVKEVGSGQSLEAKNLVVVWK